MLSSSEYRSANALNVRHTMDDEHEDSSTSIFDRRPRRIWLHAMTQKKWPVEDASCSNSSGTSSIGNGAGSGGMTAGSPSANKSGISNVSMMKVEREANASALTV